MEVENDKYSLIDDIICQVESHGCFAARLKHGVVYFVRDMELYCELVNCYNQIMQIGKTITWSKDVKNFFSELIDGIQAKKSRKYIGWILQDKDWEKEHKFSEIEKIVSAIKTNKYYYGLTSTLCNELLRCYEDIQKYGKTITTYEKVKNLFEKKVKGIQIIKSASSNVGWIIDKDFKDDNEG